MKSWISLALAVVVGCASEHHTPVRPPLLRVPRVVQTAPAREISLPVGDEVVGTVRARTESAISASVMGHVSALKVSLGSRVRAGDVLIQLSAEETTAKSTQARATFAQAKLELERATQLKASQTISSAQYDLAEARFAVAEAALAEANVMRGYSTLRAPFAGVITSKRCEVGDLAVPGKPLLLLESLDAPRFETSVPEVSAQRLHVGDSLKVRIDSLHEPVAATIVELSPSADPLSRTLLIKLDLTQVPGLRPGMFGRLQVPAGKSDTLVIPADAVVRRGQLELVYVAERGRAALRIVRTGRSYDRTIELLAGLDPGEQVVVTEPGTLEDGQPLEVRP